MAEVTRKRLDDLVEMLKASERELRETSPDDSDAADAAEEVSRRAEEIERLTGGGDLDAAEESASELWKQLLEFQVIRDLIGSRAPGPAPPVDYLRTTVIKIRMMNER